LQEMRFLIVLLRLGVSQTDLLGGMLMEEKFR